MSAPVFVPILLDDDQAAACLGVKRVKFHELRDEPWMPKPVVLGPRCVRWSYQELMAAVASMPRQVERSEPASLARSRIERMKREGAAA